MKPFQPIAWMILLAVPAAAFAADARTEYYQRAAERDASLFHALDLDGNGALTRLETQGDLDLGPRFDDMDINRDGVVSLAELQRYIEQRYGVQAAVPK